VSTLQFYRIRSGLVFGGQVKSSIALGPLAPTLGDLNADGQVNMTDLLNLIASWEMTHSSADLNGDGTVGVGDILLIIDNWG